MEWVYKAIHAFLVPLKAIRMHIEDLKDPAIEWNPCQSWELAELWAPNPHFGSSSCTIKKMKSQAIDWKGIFANHVHEKSYLSTIYKNLLQLNCKATKKPKKEMGKTFALKFPNEDTQISNKHMKRSSISLVTREM